MPQNIKVSRTSIKIDFEDEFDESIFEKLQCNKDSIINFVSIILDNQVLKYHGKDGKSHTELVEKSYSDLLRENSQLNDKLRQMEMSKVKVIKDVLDLDSIILDTSRRIGVESDKFDSKSVLSTTSEKSNLVKFVTLAHRVNKIVKLLRGSFRNKLARRGMIPSAHASLFLKSAQETEPALTSLLSELAEKYLFRYTFILSYPHTVLRDMTS